MADLTPAREAAGVLLDVLAALDPDGDLESNVRAVNAAVAALGATRSVTTSASGDLVLVDSRQLVTGVLVLASELLRRASLAAGADRDSVIADVRAALRDEW